MPIKYSSFGSYNSIDSPWVSDRMDESSNNFSDIFKKMTENFYTPSSIINTGPYIGIVLRNDTNRICPQPGTWVSSVFGGDRRDETQKPILIHIKVRIPEIHSGIPIPETIGNNALDRDQKIIDLYPTFIGQSKDLPIPDPGSIVWVDFGNKINFTNPIYIKLIENSKSNPGICGNVSAISTHLSPCVDNFLLKQPSGDIISSKNKALSHSGLPLNSRKTNQSVSTEFKYIKGSRISEEVYNKWKKFMDKKGVPSISWIGTMNFNGLVDNNHKRNHRQTIICIPNVIDYEKDIELIYYFHGLNEFGNNYDFENRYIPSIKTLTERGRNFIFVIPELPWSIDSVEPKKAVFRMDAWKGNDNFGNFHRDVLTVIKENFSTKSNIGYITIVGHNYGSGAIRNIVSNGELSSLQPKNRIIITEGCYYNYLDYIYNNFCKLNPNVEISIIVQKNGLSYKRLQDFLNKNDNLTNFYYQVIEGKNYNQIGDMGIIYENQKKNEEIFNKLESAKDKQIVDLDAEEGPGGVLKPTIKLKQFPTRSDSKMPLGNNADVSPSIVPKQSISKNKLSGVMVKESIPFEEARVRLSDYGSLSGNEGLLVGIPSVGGQQFLHKLVAKRLMLLNEQWVKDNPGFPRIMIQSGWRMKRWSSREEYEMYISREYPNGDGSKWVAFDSPHEAGLAMDIGNNGLTVNKRTNEQQKQTTLYKWLVRNAHKFGFTPYKVEAWHWECRLPRESWASGEEFVTGEEYAVRVENPGTGGRIPKGIGSGVVMNCRVEIGNPLGVSGMKDKLTLDKKRELIKELSTELGIEPETAMAFLMVESRGNAINPVTGKPMIRFEPHVFANPKRMEMFGVSEQSIPWSGGSSSEMKRKWESLGYSHGSTPETNNREYEALSAAIKINEEMAYQSISIGIGQIMGYHYKNQGFSSAKEMFEKYCESEEQQLRGFFKFIGKYNKGRLLQSLQRKDFVSAARMYNGSGKEELYASKVENYYSKYVDGKVFTA